MIRASSRGIPYQAEFTNGSRSGVADVPVEKGEKAASGRTNWSRRRLPPV